MEAARNILLALASFGLACFALGLGFERPSEITRALNYLEDRGDDFEVVFLGPSYVESQVLLSVFDAQMAQRGYPFRSFNFGLAAMGGVEQFEITQRLARLELPALRWLISDVTTGPAAKLEPENWWKARSIEWHTAEALSRRLFRFRGTFGGSGVDAHLLHTAAHYTNFGVGAALLREPSPFVRATLEAAPDYWRSRAGVLHRPRANRGLARGRHREMMNALRVCRADTDEVHLKPHFAREIRRTFPAQIGTAFLVAPVSWRCTTPAPDPGEEAELPIFAFNDPEAWPELFVRENRVNQNHLNEAGARLYSIAIANALADVMDAADERER